VAAGLFGIFLGQFGVHNFYLGYTTKAVIQLVCTIVGYCLTCLGIGALIVIGIGIWGLVEGIMILCGKIDRDGQGLLLVD
jgi:TM2 domain-containing membrane protein YozV